MTLRTAATGAVLTLAILISGCWMVDALKPQPEVNARYTAARELYENGDYARAEVGFKSHLAAFPESPLAGWDRYYIAQCYRQQGMHAEAVEAFTEFLKDPQIPEIVPVAQLDMGDCCRSTGDVERAREMYEKVIGSTNPDSPFAKAARGRLNELKNAPETEKKTTPETEKKTAN